MDSSNTGGPSDPNALPPAANDNVVGFNVLSTLPGGTKFDANKPRPDLLAWDVVNPAANWLGVNADKVSAPRSVTELKHQLWQIMMDLRNWAHTPETKGQPSSDRIIRLFARSLVVLKAVLPVRAVDADYSAAVIEVAKVLAFGAVKYADRNWELGIRYSRVYAAALRHSYAVMSGEDHDAETGLHHLAHFCCCLMFLGAFEARNMGQSWDDRAHSPFGN